MDITTSPHGSSVKALVPLADVFNHRCQKVPKGEAVRELSGVRRDWGLQVDAWDERTVKLR